MRRAHLLLVLLLIAGGALAYYGYRSEWELPAIPEASVPEGGKPAPAKRAEPASLTRPTFDVVRAEPTGDLVMAGRAEPGWSVTVESNGQVLGSAVADPQGEWVIIPGTPVKKGEHSLGLKSQSASGQQMLFSKQRLALAIGDANKGRPLVALTEEGEPTRVLQMSPSAPDEKRTASVAASAVSAVPDLLNPQTNAAAASPSVLAPSVVAPAEAAAQVAFTSIDYEPNSGNAVFFTGRGVPGARVMLYIDNEFAGTATVDAASGWTFRGARAMNAGPHMLRADHVDLASGKVLARAEVTFDREAPRAIALADTAAPQAQPRTVASVETADAQGATSSAAAVSMIDANTGATKVGPDRRVIIVRRGDTLWQIAERHYGDGSKFTQIFQTNKGQIRNPNLIYPSQRFSVPK